MPSCSIIINLYVLEDRLAHLLSRHNRLILDRFHFHRMEETLNTSIVPAVSFPTHTLLEIISSYEISIIL